MGLVISLITTLIGAATTIKSQIDQDTSDDDKRRLDKIRNPITPPSFYKDLEEREKNVPTGPYSVDKIRESINRDVIPVGYSTEQLSEVGFKSEVDKFIERREKIRKDNLDLLSKNLKTISDSLRDNFNKFDLTKDDRKSLERIDFFNKDKNESIAIQIDQWTEQAKVGEITSKTLDNLISFFNQKTGFAQDSINVTQKQNDAQLNIEKAQDARDTSSLKVINRALGINTMDKR